jgi:hypothetical protein
MKTITGFLTAILLSLSFCLSAQELQPAQSRTPSVRTTRTDRERSYDESKQYIIFKLWTDADPLSQEEKNDLQYLKQQLNGKNVTVIDYQYKTAEDLENVLKANGIEGVTVSTDNGIHMKSENSNYNTSAQKAVFLFEEKSAGKKIPVMISAGTNSMNNVKRFFRLRSFS